MKMIIYFFSGFHDAHVLRCHNNWKKELLNWLKQGLKRCSQRSRSSVFDKVEEFWSKLSTNPLLSDATEKLLFIHRLF